MRKLLTLREKEFVERAIELEKALKWALERIEPQKAAIDQLNEIKYRGLIDERC